MKATPAITATATTTPTPTPALAPVESPELEPDEFEAASGELELELELEPASTVLELSVTSETLGKDPFAVAVALVEFLRSMN